MKYKKVDFFNKYILSTNIKISVVNKMKYNNKITNSQKKSKLKKELEEKLNERGVQFRSQSILCAKYINGTIDLSLDHVVQRMCEMKYLYEYCDMKNIRTQIYNDFVNSGYVKNHKGSISAQAEKIALETYSNGVYPDIFPWEKCDTDDICGDCIDAIYFPFVPMFISGIVISLALIYILENYKIY
jgi:hypothetical protein